LILAQIERWRYA